MNKNEHLTICKANQVRGHTLVFRDAKTDDAEFIYSLRTDEKKSRHLSKISSDVNAQRTWLENYAKDDGQAYFVIQSNDARIGTVRLYDAREESFCWGSWVLKDGCPRQAAVESALMVYAYAVDHLGFRASHFDVRKENKRVWQFHERFGAQRVGETEFDYLYSLSLEAIQRSRQKFHIFLPNDITIVEG